MGTTTVSGPWWTRVVVGVGVMVKVGVGVGVWVAVAVRVGEGSAVAVIVMVGSEAASTSPPQAVISADTANVKRTSCFIDTKMLSPPYPIWTLYPVRGTRPRRLEVALSD